MKCLRSCLLSIEKLTTQPFTSIRYCSIVVIALISSFAFTQDQPQAAPPPDSAQVQVESQPSTITIPSGTRLAMVLTQPVQTRYIHRGDDIYAQITSPVDAENRVVIPPGTFVQGTVEKIMRNGGRGELRLQSMSITFPDGYVTPIAGPIVMETDQGYAIKDPGSKRAASIVVLPLAGVGLGALIGHSVGAADSSVTSNFPPGCSPPQFGCTTISTPVMGSKGKDAAIGAAVGSAAGMIGSLFLLVSSHHFYLDAGAPVQMTLQQPVTLKQDEVAKAVRQSQQSAVVVQPVAPRPMPYPVSDNGVCYTAGTPGTPPTVIPGMAGADGVPGPPTIIPGTPPSPGMPYPCP